MSAEWERTRTMRIARNPGLYLPLFLACALTSAHAQTKPEVVDLFAPASPTAQRSVRTSGGAPVIPGMDPETVGAVSYFSLSPAGTRSVRSARSGAASQGFRIALPDGSTVVCNVAPEQRTGGVM